MSLSILIIYDRSPVVFNSATRLFLAFGAAGLFSFFARGSVCTFSRPFTSSTTLSDVLRDDTAESSSLVGREFRTLASTLGLVPLLTRAGSCLLGVGSDVLLLILPV